MLTGILKVAFRPINFHGRRSHPFYWSPAFALLTLVGLVIFHWITSFPQTPLPVAEPLELAILIMVFGIPLAFVVGGVPYILVTLDNIWGYRGTQCALLSVCFVFILAFWANPNIETSLIRTFFQTAGVVATLSLFLWPVVKFMGSSQMELQRHEELILFNAVNALVRRGEISYEEAELVAPLSYLGALDPSVRLQSLSNKALTSIVREYEIERLLQDKRRKT